MEYKGYKIEGDGTYGNKVIKPIGKGSVHKNLRGSFTTSVFAIKHIDAHLEGIENGKVKTSSGI
jgi:hypothetical protein|tara:strand:+ start:1362 stop:1553 length:192 start_codon:yes stop_codon:yes gene_type:complete